MQDSLRPLVFTFAFHPGLLPFQSDLLGSHHTPAHPITPQLRLCRSSPLLLLLVDGCHRVQAALGENRLGFVCAIICPRGFTALLVAFQPSSRDYLGSRAESSHRQPFVLLKDLLPPHMSVSDAVEAAPIYVSVLISSPAFQRCSYKTSRLISFPSSPDQKLLSLLCFRAAGVGGSVAVSRFQTAANIDYARAALPGGSPHPSGTPTPAGPECVHHIRDYLEGRSVAIAH